jgi:hypothetical protein
MLDAVKEWGLNGDGEADSTDAFLRMRDAFLGDRERMWEVEFRRGRYLTRAPHWLDGVGRVRLIGYGATLQQMNAGYSLFSGSEPFLTETWNPPFTSVAIQHHPGCKIASVAAGARAITFLEEAPALVPGAIVFIAGRAQQFQNLHLAEDQWQLNGWPPNLRYFEFARVVSFDGSVAMLDRRLTHAYDQGWRDYPGDYFSPYVAGAPRLYLCNRRGFDIPLLIEMHGFSFARAAGSVAGSGHIGFRAALELLLEDCTIQDDFGLSCFVQMNDRVTLRRCKLDEVEIDKCLRHVLIEDCDITGLTSDGAGALEVEVRRSRIYDDFRVNPRTSVVIDDATSFSNFSLNAHHGGYYTTDPVMITVRATRP